MSSNLKKKLCWNCEGRVSFSQENCPFCGVYLSPTENTKGHANESQLVPPYKMAAEDEGVPASPYAQDQSPKKTSEKALPQEALQEMGEKDEFKQLVIAMCALIIGSGLALFGLVLFLFSQDGALLLRWEASYWYAYLVLAVPMLAIGWRSLQKF